MERVAKRDRINGKEKKRNIVPDLVSLTQAECILVHKALNSVAVTGLKNQAEILNLAMKIETALNPGLMPGLIAKQNGQDSGK